MTVRICLKTKKATHLDNVVMKQGDVVEFNDIDDLDPPVPERVALLRVCAIGDVVDGLGMRLDADTYIVQEA
jgi:hypothetical protein